MADSDVAFRFRPEFPAQRSIARQFRPLLLRKMTALLRKIGRFEPERNGAKGPAALRRTPLPDHGARRR